MNCKPSHYRKREKDWPGGIRYNRIMTAHSFDPALVKATMKEQRINQAQLASVAGVPTQSAISEMLNGKRQVKVQEADKIYRFLGLSAIGGADVMTVPVIGLAAAGNWREAIVDPMGRIVLPKHAAGPRSFGVEVAGDSMNELIEDGGWIVIDPDDKELVNSKCYMIQNADFEVTVKMYRTSPARFVPVSSNGEHKAFEVSEQDFVVVGRVVWKGEKL